MSEHIQIAQSYAKAVHELCTSAAQADVWSQQLSFLADVTRNEDMIHYLGDVSRPSEVRTSGFLAVVSSELDAAGVNLVRLMGENGRLSLFPSVAEQFEALRAQAEQRITATVISAQPLTENEINNITAALKKRLNRSIDLQAQVDSDLIGGAVIRAGDWLIDGSMRGGIEKLAAQLSR
ncbi:MAG TPA: F0F1 ATP synthase subunit delta [Halothiobacillus sp.]|jgi:F-type H+-transporting ATPase subunit delta|nr:F0F1 ATP synthase subunit delta [Halothiobacillus sp.]